MKPSDQQPPPLTHADGANLNHPAKLGDTQCGLPCSHLNVDLSVFPSVVPHMAVAHALAQLVATAGGEQTWKR